MSVDYVGDSWFELWLGAVVWPFRLEFDRGSCHAWVIDVFGDLVARMGWCDLTVENLAVVAASYFTEEGS